MNAATSAAKSYRCLSHLDNYEFARADAPFTSKEVDMNTIEKEMLPGYEWELDFCCERCGSAHYLIFDKETEKTYCAPCLQFIRGYQKTQADPADLMEDDDFVF